MTPLLPSLLMIKSWTIRHFFSTPINTLISLSLFGLCVWVLPPLLQWTVLDANFSGHTREACTGGGACWVFVKERFDQFIYGFYPASERWRANLVMAAWIVMITYFGWRIRDRRFQVKEFICMVAILVLISWVLLYGGFLYLPTVDTDQWGGLLLTLVVSIVGMIFSLPIGILLALARRSELPIARSSATLFIELWRGVPLLTVLFMASVMFPLFLPSGVHPDKLLRCLVGLVLFASAYIAEVVRGGLQALPRSQYEASNVLGLSYWQSTRLVILPQALRLVIPGIVNTFIGLFKDTTLVMVVGMFDFLGMVQAGLNDPNWLGFALEGYVFAGLIFWIFCFGMSRFSLKIERMALIKS